MTDLATISSILAGKLNDKVEALEAVTKSLPQLDLPVTESLKDGLYTRQLFIPTGTILTGRVWLDDYVDIMISGEIIVATAAGVLTLSGYNILDGKAGRKRAGYAVKDTLWLTVHKTQATEVAGLLEQLSVFSMREYEVKMAQLSYTTQFGHFEQEIQAQVQNTEDLVKLPALFDNVVVKESPVHGKGLFTTRHHFRGEHIAPARLNKYRTCAGRYTNHSGKPNACMVLIDDHVALVAMQDISADEEVLIDYMRTIQDLEGICQE